MSAKLSVEDVVANLEARAAFHGEQEALHAQQEAHHREQRAVHAAELAKVHQHLETFREAAAPALELARIPIAPSPSAADPLLENLPAPGRPMVSRLLRQLVAGLPEGEPFSATAVAAEANRRFGKRLKSAIDPRAAADVLRRLAREGAIRVVREGKPFHEALYGKGRAADG